MNLTSIKHFKHSFHGLLAEDSFRRNLAITFSGQAVGQVVGFLFTPFIARAYGPENYGIFSLFVAITTNFFSVATLQLPTGYVAARSQRELHVLLQITFASLVLFTSIFGIIIFFYKESILNVLDAGSLSYLIYLVPIYAFFMGLDYMMLGWNIYLKEFGRGAIAKISSVVISKGTTLLYALIAAPSPIGLIVGSFLIYPLESAVKFSKQIRTEILNVSKLASWHEVKKTIQQYKSYPLFVTPGLLIASVNGQLPVYFFSIYFHNSFVGLFSLANSIVTVPISVITNSTTTVFLQKAAETLRTNPSLLKDLVLQLHKKIFLICFIPLSIFAFASTWIFQLVFGIQWEEAGWIAAFLSISTILSAPQQPLSVLFRLLNKEHNNLILNASSIVLRALGLSVGVLFADVKIAIAGYVLASIATVALSLGLIFSMVNIKVIKLGWYIIAVLCIFGLLVFQKF